MTSLLLTSLLVIGSQALAVFGIWHFLLRNRDTEEDTESVVIRYRDDGVDITFLNELTSTMGYVPFRAFLKSLSLAIGRAEIYCGNIGMRVYANEVCPFVWMGDEDDIPEDSLDDNLYILSLDDAGSFLEDAEEGIEAALERSQGGFWSRWQERRKQDKLNDDEDMENWWLSV